MKVLKHNPSQRSILLKKFRVVKKILEFCSILWLENKPIEQLITHASGFRLTTFKAVEQNVEHGWLISDAGIHRYRDQWVTMMPVTFFVPIHCKCRHIAKSCRCHLCRATRFSFQSKSLDWHRKVSTIWRYQRP